MIEPHVIHTEEDMIRLSKFIIESIKANPCEPIYVLFGTDRSVFELGEKRE